MQKETSADMVQSLYTAAERLKSQTKYCFAQKIAASLLPLYSTEGNEMETSAKQSKARLLHALENYNAALEKYTNTVESNEAVHYLTGEQIMVNTILKMMN